PGDGYHESEVGFQEVPLGPAAFVREPGKLVSGGLQRARWRTLGKEMFGEQAGLDSLGKLDLPRGVEQRGTRDLVKVATDEVAFLDLILGTPATHCQRSSLENQWASAPARCPVVARSNERVICANE